ncbi:MAG: GAF domain-containing protein [Gammaproteobacteria bacterium]
MKASAEALRALQRELAARTAELEKRDAELAAARIAGEHHAATAEVLRIIGDSPGDSQRVLEAILERAVTLADGNSGVIVHFDGQLLHQAALYGRAAENAYAVFPHAPDHGSMVGRAVLQCAPVQSTDLWNDPGYPPEVRELARSQDARSALGVPLRHAGRVVGAISVGRASAGDFADEFVAALLIFADQAVIAIENARLFNQARQALERQTATAEVLEVISRSPADLQPVFDAIAERARVLCGGAFGVVTHFDGTLVHMRAMQGPSAEMGADLWAQYPRPVDRSSVTGRAILTCAPVRVDDYFGDPELDPAMKAAGIARGFSAASGIAVPMLRAGQALGSIYVGRETSGRWPDEAIELLETFAAQAVIAIENTRLFNETQEALEQQTASAEVLAVISQSVTDAQPVMDTIVERCLQLFGADAAQIWMLEGNDQLTLVALGGAPYSKLDLHDLPTRVSMDSDPALALIAQGQTVHDLEVTAEIGSEAMREWARKAGSASGLRTPLMVNGQFSGVLLVGRYPPKPFTDKEIALLKSFADQAVIAIQNARLFRETQEALAQQTASAEVLRVISGSVEDAQPVFEAIVESCARLFHTDQVGISVTDDQHLTARLVAVRGPSSDDIQQLFSAPIPIDESNLPAAFHAGHTVIYPHVSARSDVPVSLKQAQRLVGDYSMMVAPMLREGRGLGVLWLYATPPRPFSAKEQALFATFADQAVIAIENTRLFNETQEALEQQTASAEVLQVISRSVTDAQPVMDTIVARCLQLFGADGAQIWMVKDGDQVALAAIVGQPYTTLNLDDVPTSVRVDSAPYLATIAKGETVQHPEVTSESADPDLREWARAIGPYSIVRAPLMVNGQFSGVLLVVRCPSKAFSEQEIALLKSFADQAVIAIQNARQFRETQEALERQTATAGVLQVISSSVEDAAPVFEKILDSCEALFGADVVGIAQLRDDGTLDLSARRGVDVSVSDEHALDDTVTGLSIRERRVVHIPDTAREPQLDGIQRQSVERYGHFSLLVAPLLWKGAGIGSIFLGRFPARPFSDQEIDLLRTFTDQAVIAIQNAKLFRDTTEALERQTATADVLRVISQSPTDVQPVFDAIAERARVLCGGDGAGVEVARDGLAHLVAFVMPVPEAEDAYRAMFPRPIDRSVAGTRAMVDGTTIHITDYQNDPDFDPQAKATARRAGLSPTAIATPMRRGTEIVGAIFVGRNDGTPFTDKDAQLLETFADQAVIAIENTRLFNETQAALERQTATSEVLAVIGSSPTDVQPVFDAIVERAMNLCGANFGMAVRYDGRLMHLAAARGFRDSNPLDQWQGVAPERGIGQGRAILEGRTIEIPDVDTDPEYGLSARATLDGYRSLVAVPMLRQGRCIGTIAVGRAEAGAFPPNLVRLLETFADQAVIALENTRLFNETQEALERQTATAEVLRTISSSVKETEPVFEAILDSCQRLFKVANYGILLAEGDGLGRFVARLDTDADPALKTLPFEAEAVPLDSLVSGQAVLERRVVYVPDAEAETDAPENTRRLLEQFGNYSLLCAPLLHEGRALGALCLWHRPPRPFDDKEIALLETFADQAVIAIENTRLFNETQEALERQMATADVLRVISSSVKETGPVFEVILESCQRLFKVPNYGILLAEGNGLGRFVARRIQADTPAEGLPDEAVPLDSFISGRAVIEKRVIYVPDAQAESGLPENSRRLVERIGNYSMLCAPLLHEGHALGALWLSHRPPRPFDAKEVALLQTFADQAVIALENTRLFTETQEALERQTATAEVLEVISSSPTNVQPVFEAILARAMALCDAEYGAATRFDGEMLHITCTRGMNEVDVAAGAAAYPRAPTNATVQGRAVLARAPVQIPDLKADPDYAIGFSSDMNSALSVPLLRGGEAVGTIALMRRETGPFPDAQVRLLQTFADQAVIALENTRLFTETQEALERQTATAEVLGVISNSPTDVAPVFQAIAERGRALARASLCMVTRLDGDQVRLVGVDGASQDTVAQIEALFPMAMDRRTSLSTRAMLAQKPVQIRDVLDDAEFTAALKDSYLATGLRSGLAAPMISGKEVIGAIFVSRSEASEYPDNLVQLLETFAAQAVIAIDNVRLFNETRDALDRQTAISDILRVTTESPSDVEPILGAIAEHAARLCDASSASIFLAEDDLLQHVASRGPRADQAGSVSPFPIDRGSMTGRAILDRRTIAVDDMQAETAEYARSSEIARQLGHRSTVAAPLMREGRAFGALLLRRQELRPFGERELALLRTFGDQAAIAIASVRLFKQTEEALEQQTATADILRVIGNSVEDTAPVFETIIERCQKLIEAETQMISLVDERGLVQLAAIRAPAAMVAAAEQTYPVRFEDSVTALVAKDGETLCVPSVMNAEGVPTMKRIAEQFGDYAAVIAPLVLRGRVVGSIGAARGTSRPFSKREIDLMSTFADQAVIAIQNAQLFRETHEALEQQTAMADILRVIGGSVEDTAPVFETILDRSEQLVEAESQIIFLVDEREQVSVGAIRGPTEVIAAAEAVYPIPLVDTATSLVLQTRKALHVPSVAAQAERPRSMQTIYELIGDWSMVIAPLVLRDRVVGSLTTTRMPPRPFNQREIDLLSTFADQAVIAIQNAQLFRETHEALERQTATAEVLSVISRSVEDTAPVFDAILHACTELFGSEQIALYRVNEDDVVELQGYLGPDADAVRALYPRPLADSGLRVVAESATATHWPSISAIAADASDAAAAIEAMGDFSLIAAPLFWERRCIGFLTVARVPPQPFDDKEIRLLQTFADQAVIAIQNARMFRETHEALEQQTASAEVLRTISQSVADTRPVYERIMDNCQALLGVDEIIISRVRDGELHVEAHRGQWVAQGVAAYQPMPVGETGAGRPIAEGRVVHIPDAAEALGELPPGWRPLWDNVGNFSCLDAPLLREGRGIGLISVVRVPPKPFTPREIALLSTFADQAVIAIENARLFRETEEALEQQTASAEVLRTISQSVADTEPVFARILESCERLFGTEQVGIGLVEADGMARGVFGRGDYGDKLRAVYPVDDQRVPIQDTVMPWAFEAGHTIYVPDTADLDDPPPGVRWVMDAFGDFSMMVAPMNRDGRNLGVIWVFSTPPRPFSAKEIQLCTSFADQAVIAIENARLFNETHEALERQTATAEVLKVISTSVEDTTPVFAKILESCRRLFGTEQIGLFMLNEQNEVYLPAIHGEAGVGIASAYPLPLADSLFRVPAASGTVEYFPSVAAIEDKARDSMLILEAVGDHSLLAAPMTWEGRSLGFIGVGRFPPRPFSDKEASLLQTFADQAAIALQNARMFRETNEALEQQTATAGVLSVISGSVDDAQPVFDAIVDSCARLFGTELVGINLVTGDSVNRATQIRGPADVLLNLFPGDVALEDTVLPRAFAARRTIHFPLVDDASDLPMAMTAMWEHVGDYSMMVAPMMREGRGLGVVWVYAVPPRSFTEKEQGLLSTFANQAVIAIENARLFRETHEALERQTATAEVLKVISSSVEDVQPVFEAIVDSCARVFDTEQLGITMVDEQSEMTRLVAIRGPSTETFKDLFMRPRPMADSALPEAFRAGRTIIYGHVDAHSDAPAMLKQGQQVIGDYAMMVAPMMREGRGLGVLWIYATPPRPFSAEEQELFTTFADQAVIAIENARLFHETQEALEQQTASADVLRVISSSVEDTRPVFEKIIKSCEHLFGADQIGIYVVGDDGLVHIGAHRGHQLEMTTDLFPGQFAGSATELVLKRRAPYHVHDVSVEKDLPATIRKLAERIGTPYSLLMVPLRKDRRDIGSLVVTRDPPRPFHDKEIALLATFADQAVIAIENARLFHEIEAKSRELAAANQHKSEFLANMSHELRTPLNAIIGFSEVMIEGLFGELNEKQDDYLKDIHSSGEHLLSLINDILDLSKIEAGRMELDVESFDIGAALGNTLTLIRERAQQHGIHLAFEAAGELGEMRADQRKLKQVMLNLLSNAVKFTPDGGSITVRAAYEGEVLAVSVTDTGIGIAPEDQEAVFQEFRQAGGQHLNKSEGTGLGLSLTRRFVEMHGGTISLDSTVGEGSTFAFTLPSQTGARAA